jgi:hypothetical protein
VTSRPITDASESGSRATFLLDVRLFPGRRRRVNGTGAAAYPLGVITRSFPILSTPDLRRALSFYVDALGGSVSYRFPETGELEYVTVRLRSSTSPRTNGGANGWRACSIRTVIG